MMNERDESKKNLPGSFFLLLLLSLLAVASLQNFISTKRANVSFSYQLEHLVNLGMLVPEESKKVAQNDKLVTFTGKFHKELSEEGQERFKYLDRLNQQHQLKNEKDYTLESLAKEKAQVEAAAKWYLSVSAYKAESSGFRVVGEIYDTPQLANHIILADQPEAAVNLRLLEQEFSAGVSNVKEFEAKLYTLLNHFRSPVLGIGNEQMKHRLRDLDQELSVKRSSQVDEQQKLAFYKEVLAEIGELSQSLAKVQDHVRLSELRSVRNYYQDLQDLQRINDALESNEAQVEKLRPLQVTWFFNDKELSTRSLEKENAETYSHWFSSAKQEWENFPNNKDARFKAPDQPRNKVLERVFKSVEPSPNYAGYFMTFLPVMILFGVLYFVFSRQMKGMGNTAMNFGKSTAKMHPKGTTKVTFADVAGIDEAKEELEEIVDFLKDPSKFTVLGGRIPKGVLCIGPPGTGKTLIARAVAGEAGRPFFSISGSDFVEMFVGVGASRVRDLFEKAKKNAPCIIFMDEIDAVGRHRGAGIGGGHDEREQTLNQLLVEMDGFEGSEGIILIAATNRPDVLDKALLRPGRFDRRIIIDLPDLKGRYEILKVHASKVKLDDSVDLMNIAKATAGSSGADLMNLLNEAALLAARKSRTAVTVAETSEATDKVRYGKERRSLGLDEQEKKTTAIHEAGHTVVALKVQHSDPVDKVTIIPRGLSLGATHFLPEKNRVSYWKKELHDQLAVLLGGRIAEEVFLDDMSSGAQQDIEMATKLARNMVCNWGMSDKMGMVAYEERDDQYGMYGNKQKKYSEESAREIDKEVKKLINDAYAVATQIIEDNKERLQYMADMLLRFETLDNSDIKKIIEDSFDEEGKEQSLRELAERHKQASPPALPLEEGESSAKTPDLNLETSS